MRASFGTKKEARQGDIAHDFTTRPIHIFDIVFLIFIRLQLIKTTEIPLDYNFTCYYRDYVIELQQTYKTIN